MFRRDLMRTLDRVSAAPCTNAREPTAMAKHKSDFLNILDERGFIHQCSDFAGLDALAAKGEVIAYVGYDCTAPSLHIGNFLTIMMLHWLQQIGQQADHADGRRHHARRRPLGQGRDARHPPDRGDRGQQGRACRASSPSS